MVPRVWTIHTVIGEYGGYAQYFLASYSNRVCFFRGGVRVECPLMKAFRSSIFAYQGSINYAVRKLEFLYCCVVEGWSRCLFCLVVLFPFRGLLHHVNPLPPSLVCLRFPIQSTSALSWKMVWNEMVGIFLIPFRPMWCVTALQVKQYVKLAEEAIDGLWSPDVATAK